MKKISLLLFFGIFVLGIFLRFYVLGGVPTSLHVDEAYFGYNAYSLLTTARDMTGNLLPIHFASFLFSPVGYSYLSIPWIFLFGLSNFSIRFASAFFGSLTLVVIFFLARKITPDPKQKNSIALASMFFLAISPWHIILSRTATENVIVVFFLALGVLLLLYWKEKTSLVYGLGVFASFGITLLLYQAPRAFLPIFLPLLFGLLFLQQKKKLMVSIALYGVIILLPLFLILKSPQLSARINMLSVFKYPGVQLLLDEQIREDGVMHSPALVSRLFHNKITAYSSQVLHNYFLHFSYDFLFSDGYLPMRYVVPSTGLFYLGEIPFMLLGLYFLLKKRPLLFTLLVGWILIGPIGSALTFDDIPNMQRTLLIFPAVSLVEGFGFFQFLQVTRQMKKIWQLFLYGLVFLVALYSLGFFLHQYFVNGIVHRPWYRQEGTREMVTAVNSVKQKYAAVDVGNADPNLSIFFLLYNKYNPYAFQQYLLRNPQLVAGGHYGSISFDQYIFNADGCPVQEKQLLPTDTLPTVTGKPGVLYVDEGICKIPTTHVKVLATIKKPDNTPAYYLLEYVR